MSNSERNQPYIIKPSMEQNTVEVWSTKRLPFEPKEWRKDLRQDIRKAVNNLKGGQGYVLHGLYGTHLEESCDVENILFYNVGTGCFSHLTQYGIRFERSFSYPTPSQPLMGHLHYHRYALMDEKAGFLHWQMGQPLARWNSITISPITSSTKPAPIWHTFSSEPVEILHKLTNPLKPFGLKITIMVPNNKVASIASFMKPLLDGIIASFHMHNSENIEILSQRVAKDLHVHSSTVAKLLCRPDRAILGKRQLLWPYRSNVQWNPGDDLCFATEISIQTSSSSQWAISGMLFEIDAIDSRVD